MDFQNVKRKELQALCKKHGVPANLSNHDMATRLSLIFKDKRKPLNWGRSCLKNSVDSGSEDSCKDGLREAKKVRFSPVNETFTFEAFKIDTGQGNPNMVMTRATRSRLLSVSMSGENVDNVDLDTENPNNNRVEGVVTRRRGRSRDSEVPVEDHRGDTSTKGVVMDSRKRRRISVSSNKDSELAIESGVVKGLRRSKRNKDANKDSMVMSGELEEGENLRRRSQQRRIAEEKDIVAVGGGTGSGVDCHKGFTTDTELKHSKKLSRKKADRGMPVKAQNRQVTSDRPPVEVDVVKPLKNSTGEGVSESNGIVNSFGKMEVVPSLKVPLRRSRRTSMYKFNSTIEEVEAHDGAIGDVSSLQLGEPETVVETHATCKPRKRFRSLKPIVEGMTSESEKDLVNKPSRQSPSSSAQAFELKKRRGRSKVRESAVVCDEVPAPKVARSSKVRRSARTKAPISETGAILIEKNLVHEKPALVCEKVSAPKVAGNSKGIPRRSARNSSKRKSILTPILIGEGGEKMKQQSTSNVPVLEVDAPPRETNQVFQDHKSSGKAAKRKHPRRPKTAESSEPDPVRSSEPDAVRSSEPDTVRSSEPDTVRNSEPDTVRDLEDGFQQYTSHSTETGDLEEGNKGDASTELTEVAHGSSDQEPDISVSELLTAAKVVETDIVEGNLAQDEDTFKDNKGDLRGDASQLKREEVKANNIVRGEMLDKQHQSDYMPTFDVIYSPIRCSPAYVEDGVGTSPEVLECREEMEQGPQSDQHQSRSIPATDDTSIAKDQGPAYVADDVGQEIKNEEALINQTPDQENFAVDLPVKDAKDFAHVVPISVEVEDSEGVHRPVIHQSPHMELYDKLIKDGELLIELMSPEKVSTIGLAAKDNAEPSFELQTLTVCKKPEKVDEAVFEETSVKDSDDKLQKSERSLSAQPTNVLETSSRTSICSQKSTYKVVKVSINDDDETHEGIIQKPYETSQCISSDSPVLENSGRTSSTIEEGSSACAVGYEEVSGHKHIPGVAYEGGLLSGSRSKGSRVEKSEVGMEEMKRSDQVFSEEPEGNNEPLLHPISSKDHTSEFSESKALRKKVETVCDKVVRCGELENSAGAVTPLIFVEREVDGGGLPFERSIESKLEESMEMDVFKTSAKTAICNQERGDEVVEATENYFEKTHDEVIIHKVSEPSQCIGNVTPVVEKSSPTVEEEHHVGHLFCDIASEEASDHKNKLEAESSIGGFCLEKLEAGKEEMKTSEQVFGEEPEGVNEPVLHPISAKDHPSELSVTGGSTKEIVTVTEEVENCGVLEKSGGEVTPHILKERESVGDEMHSERKCESKLKEAMEMDAFEASVRTAICNQESSSNKFAGATISDHEATHEEIIHKVCEASRCTGDVTPGLEESGPRSSPNEEDDHVRQLCMTPGSNACDVGSEEGPADKYKSDEANECELLTERRSIEGFSLELSEVGKEEMKRSKQVFREEPEGVKEPVQHPFFAKDHASELSQSGGFRKEIEIASEESAGDETHFERNTKSKWNEAMEMDAFGTSSRFAICSQESTDNVVEATTNDYKATDGESVHRVCEETLFTGNVTSVSEKSGRSSSMDEEEVYHLRHLFMTPTTNECGDGYKEAYDHESKLDAALEGEPLALGEINSEGFSLEKLEVSMEDMNRSEQGFDEVPEEIRSYFDSRDLPSDANKSPNVDCLKVLEKNKGTHLIDLGSDSVSLTSDDNDREEAREMEFYGAKLQINAEAHSEPANAILDCSENVKVFDRKNNAVKDNFVNEKIEGAHAEHTDHVEDKELLRKVEQCEQNMLSEFVCKTDQSLAGTKVISSDAEETAVGIEEGTPECIKKNHEGFEDVNVEEMEEVEEMLSDGPAELPLENLVSEDGYRQMGVVFLATKATKNHEGFEDVNVDVEIALHPTNAGNSEHSNEHPNSAMQQVHELRPLDVSDYMEDQELEDCHLTASGEPLFNNEAVHERSSLSSPSQPPPEDSFAECLKGEVQEAKYVDHGCERGGQAAEHGHVDNEKNSHDRDEPSNINAALSFSGNVLPVDGGGLMKASDEADDFTRPGKWDLQNCAEVLCEACSGKSKMSAALRVDEPISCREEHKLVNHGNTINSVAFDKLSNVSSSEAKKGTSKGEHSPSCEDTEDGDFVLAKEDAVMSQISEMQLSKHALCMEDEDVVNRVEAVKEDAVYPVARSEQGKTVEMAGTEENQDAEVAEGKQICGKRLNSCLMKSSSVKCMVQSTPERLVKMLDMKENTPMINKERSVGFRSTKTAKKRRALEDISTNLTSDPAK